MILKNGYLEEKMDEYDVLLYEINREKKRREEKKFWKGKEWTEEQIKKLEGQMKPPLQINHIESGYELQRKLMREKMGLSDTEGLTLTKENMKKLISELTESTNIFGKIFSKGVFYEDFIHFSSYLINKYFTKEEGGK